MQNSHPLLLSQYRHRNPALLKFLHCVLSRLVVILHVLLPMILPSESPDDAIIKTRFDGIPTPIVQAEIFDLVVVNNAVVMLFVIFGQWETATTLLEWTGRM
jgi:fumarate reductase subunit D